MASKSIIPDLNKGEKLNGDNYDIWSRKMWYVLEEKNALEGINHVLSLPEEGNTAQNSEVYKSWKKVDSIARGIILTIKFDTYKKRNDQNIKQYLRVMLNMIAQLKSIGHVLSDEQQVQLGAAKAIYNDFMAKSSDSGATDHVSQDREAFVEFRRVSPGSRWIYVGNNARLKVKGIGTCKVDLREGRSLMLHGVLYALEI
ncbi:uncharacterized protein LOC124892715 [Capsicum annuum]|uniref:uncharacterized protein LOC124892715 n=1 Tax=Capsicum annuum TaxID=4072 RepID=UPI001FB139CD|nr:uncharacterized protein LOC124892715 [Capsicum annuum]